MTPSPKPPGDDNRYCGARKRQGEGTCTRPAGWGTDHPGFGACKLHGGSTPAGRKHAQTLLLDRRVGDLLAEYKPPREGLSVTEQILEALRVAVGMAVVYEHIVADLAAGGLWGPDHLGDARPHVAEQRLGWWNGERARIGKLAIEANVEERQVRLLEEQASLVATAMRALLTSLLEAFVDVGGDRAMVREVEARAPELMRAALVGSREVA